MPPDALSLYAMSDEPAQHSALVAKLARDEGSRVLAVAFRILGCSDAAQDVQQDVFMRLLKRRPSRVKSWPAFLTTMATRLAIDRIRSQKRRVDLSRWFRPPPEPATPESVRADADKFGQLRAGLTGLSTRECEVFCLRYLSENSVKEISETLQITENNVTVILHRSRKKLADYLRLNHPEDQ